MFDSRFDALAEVLAGFSTRLQKGEKVLIDLFDIPPEMIVSLIRKVREKGAFLSDLPNQGHNHFGRDVEDVDQGLLALLQTGRKSGENFRQSIKTGVKHGKCLDLV